MRAFANQERLTLRTLAASLAVSRAVIGLAGFCAALEPMAEDCDLILNFFLRRWRASWRYGPDVWGLTGQDEEGSGTNHIDKNHQRVGAFCRLRSRKRLPLRSSRLPQASGLGERISG